MKKWSPFILKNNADCMTVLELACTLKDCLKSKAIHDIVFLVLVC